jgi:hypothetical protein
MHFVSNLLIIIGTLINLRIINKILYNVICLRAYIYTFMPVILKEIKK